MADSVFIRDNFCFGFDSVADSVSRNRWREDPNVVNLVELSVERIRAFLSILAELKDFIVSGALVFMPYFVTPTLPYRNVPAKLQRHIDRLRVADPSGRIWGHSIPVGDFDKVLVPWLNARLHELDPVYLSDEMARIGSTLRFDSDPAQPPPATDLLSVNILPFGGADQNDLDTLWKMRRNESVFSHI